MYTANKTNGIGQVVSETETSFVVFFSETEKTLTLLKKFTTIYATEHDAELALNPELSAEDMAEIVANEKSNQIDLSVFHKIEEINIAASKKLMQHI